MQLTQLMQQQHGKDRPHNRQPHLLTLPIKEFLKKHKEENTWYKTYKKAKAVPVITSKIEAAHPLNLVRLLV
jgi:hypothetical protein